MLVFLQIPRSTTSPYKAFREALGDEAVGWVGRNIKDEDLDNPEALAAFKVVGGRMSLARALAIEGVTTFATVINDPVARSLGQWNEAVGDTNHPHHAAAHTFMQRELFEEEHPFARAMSNVATKFLLKSEAEPVTAAAALEGIKGLRFVIGDTANTKAFAIILSRRLGLEPMAINEASFRAPPVHQVSPRGELLRLMRAANAEDIALIDGLHELRDEKRPVVRIRGERGNRPNKPGRAERQARADRPKRKDGADPLTRGERPRRRKPKAADPEAQD